MTRKIGIIGLGHVGATLAHSMILKHTCDHLVLIDTNEKKVKADALDFCDTVANTGYPVHITVNDYAALEDADVVVSTLGISSCRLITLMTVLRSFPLPASKWCK